MVWAVGWTEYSSHSWQQDVSRVSGREIALRMLGRVRRMRRVPGRGYVESRYDYSRNLRVGAVLYARDASLAVLLGR